MASSNEEIGREPFSWKRTWALAVAIGLHAFAFLLIVAPMAPQQQDHKEKERIVQVNFIEPPPPPPPPPPGMQDELQRYLPYILGGAGLFFLLLGDTRRSRRR